MIRSRDAATRRSQAGSMVGRVVGTIVVLIVVVAGLMLGATRYVESRVMKALGPHATVGDIRIGPQDIVLTDVVLAGDGTEAPAHAANVVLEPQWLSFFGDRPVLDTVTVSDFAFTVLRTEGGLQIGPGRDRKWAAPAANGADATPTHKTLSIGLFVLRDGAMTYQDDVVSKPPHQIHFTGVSARLHPVTMPVDGSHVQVEFDGSVIEPGSTGTVSAEGWMALGKTDADIAVEVRNLSVRDAGPYLQRQAPGAFSRGQMDLDMHTRIAGQSLAADGDVTLRNLAFSGGNVLFALPREAVLSALKDSKGAVHFKFSVKGSLDNPQFSPVKGFASAVTTGVASALGVQVKGAAEGVAGAVRALGNAISDTFSK